MKIGIIFQQFHLMPHLSARENISLPLEILKQDQIQDRVDAMLEKVGLSDRRHHLPGQAGLMLWIRMTLRELMKNRGFALFFILNLSLGLAGFIAIHSFGSSLNRHLDENLKEILTADLVLTSNSPLTREELMLADEVLGQNKTQAWLIAFYTMVKVGVSPSDTDDSH